MAPSSSRVPVLISVTTVESVSCSGMPSTWHGAWAGEGMKEGGRKDRGGGRREKKEKEGRRAGQIFQPGG